MSLQTSGLKRLLKEFKFKDIFLELNYNSTNRPTFVESVSSQSLAITPIAESGGLFVLEITDVRSDRLPTLPMRKAVDNAISSRYTETLLIFVNESRTESVFHRTVSVKGKRMTRSHRFFKHSPTEPLARSLIRLEIPFQILDSQGNVAFTEVTDRLEGSGLFAERVTKKFFSEFSKMRVEFVKFLGWIEDEAKRNWYCSVLLNRLMFIYFIAERGFLPDGRKFLRRLLEENRKVHGPDTFYTHALLPLSFFGLGAEQGHRDPFEKAFEGVLYLNGGLFSVHSVEQEFGIDSVSVGKGEFSPLIHIPDQEFCKWFDYFDEYQWTLDDREVANDGRYISPHILGYIFEKYINSIELGGQKAKGAYYTKEDITGYICRNTIIPRLFDMLNEESSRTGDPRYSQAVMPLPIGPHPNLLNNGLGTSGGQGIDRYIRDAAKTTAYLPMETEYEYSHRQARYERVLEDFETGKITKIDDFITNNLDIERLAVDFVSTVQDPEVLHALYFRCIQQITILDPTCGSGAFLFAALEVLYPIYNAALSRMKLLVARSGEILDTVNWKGELHFEDLEGQGTLADTVTPASLEAMAAEVRRIQDHPSAEYFIKKSIIVNNLFGVDIMEEAVEICKLRLFLTLIATVEKDESKDNLGVEPLPDIDFNVLAGNTLVGYASITDIDRLWEEVELRASKLAFEKDHSRLKNLVDVYDQVLKAWRKQQLGEWKGKPIPKDQVLHAAEAVRPELDRDIWNLYRDAGRATILEKKKARSMTQREFNKSHQPFHWLLEFPSVEARGGFEVVVGNPPYVELKDIKDYSMLGFSTESCADLYAMVAERSFHQVSPSGRTSLIVPISMFNTDGFTSLQTVAIGSSSKLWVSTYSNRPSQLFDGAQKRLTIYVSRANRSQQPSSAQIFTSKYLRWASPERDALFAAQIEYVDRTENSFQVLPSSLEKLGSLTDLSTFAKLAGAIGCLGDAIVEESGDLVYYTRKFGYFLAFLDFIPVVTRISDGISVEPSELKTLNFGTRETSLCAIAILSSSTFFWFWNVLSDVRNVNKRDLLAFPLDPLKLPGPVRQQLAQLASQYLDALRGSSSIMTKSGKRIQTFNYAAQKPTLDSIDEVLAKHFALTPTEADAILNYDLKYRLGNAQDEAE